MSPPQIKPGAFKSFLWEAYGTPMPAHTESTLKYLRHAFEVLLLIFVVLKLGSVGEFGTWSWWWVLSPIWIGALNLWALRALIALWSRRSD